MSKTRPILTLVGIATAAMMLAAPATQAAEVITLRLHTFLVPVSNPVKTFIIPWINKVNAAASQ